MRHLLSPLLATLVVLSPIPASTTTACAPQPVQEARAFDHAHAVWNRVLEQYVRGGAFDYKALKADRADLDAYVRTLAGVTKEQLAAWSEDERFAFWINAYNAFTIQKIVDNYPLKSIRKLDGLFGLSSVFDDEFIPMRALHPDGDRDDLSLNDIEHGILRKRFADARVHAAVNCASKSCPNLRAEAFVAERLDAQLDEQMRAFVGDASKNQFDAKAGVAKLSAIFDWFADDFVRDAGSVRAYVGRYASEEVASIVRTATIRHLDYDWSLNDVAR